MVYRGEQLASNYGVSAYPTIIIADKTGKVIYAGRNGFNKEEIEKIIKENL